MISDYLDKYYLLLISYLQKLAII